MPKFSRFEKHYPLVELLGCVKSKCIHWRYREHVPLLLLGPWVIMTWNYADEALELQFFVGTTFNHPRDDHLCVSQPPWCFCVGRILVEITLWSRSAHFGLALDLIVLPFRPKIQLSCPNFDVLLPVPKARLFLRHVSFQPLMMESRGCQTDKIQHRGSGHERAPPTTQGSSAASDRDDPGGRKTDVVPTFHPISKHLNRTYSQKLIRRRRKVGRTLKCLWVFTPLSCLFALSSFTSSVISSDWLRTEEKMPNLNRTILFGPNKSPEYLPKFTTSGLFELCFTQREF